MNYNFWETHGRNKKKVFVLLLTFVLLWFLYQAGNKSSILQLNIQQQEHFSVNHNSKANIWLKKVFNSKKKKYNFSLFSPVHDRPFDINSTDVIVNLHIQKTSGSTFGRHLVKDLRGIKCIKGFGKIYSCPRPTDNSQWLFSRLSTGETMYSKL